MTQEMLNYGFKRLLLKAMFHSSDFQERDNLNEYDEDYAALESEPEHADWLQEMDAKE